MLSVRACQAFFLLAAMTATSAVASRTHRAPTSGHHHAKASSKAVKHTVVRGQRGIDPDRAREIQGALIRQNYLTGTPSGQWDAQTESAMQKYQADHGWQTKLTPDSRALISLGLGPDHSAGGTTIGTTATGMPVNPVPAANTLASTHLIQN
jgi:peptidoglycan hydrolase-like protein with peptidoglycan-binding domain